MGSLLSSRAVCDVSKLYQDIVTQKELMFVSIIAEKVQFRKNKAVPFYAYFL